MKSEDFSMNVGANVPPEKTVQSISVGNTPHTRKRKVKELQGITKPTTSGLKKIMNDQLTKMSKDLR